MKAIMLSIRPEWCEKIISREKTIEVRKTRPKLDSPFKCYIYCTDGNTIYKSNADGAIRLYRKKAHRNFQHHTVMNGKVIGEFICDEVMPMSVEYSVQECHVAMKEFPYTGMTDKQIIDYLGNGELGYGWFIFNLSIYDTPKELSAFQIRKDCGSYIKWHNLTRPSQSWCYVEEFEG